MTICRKQNSLGDPKLPYSQRLFFTRAACLAHSSDAERHLDKTAALNLILCPQHKPNRDCSRGKIRNPGRERWRKHAQIPEITE